MTITAVTPPDAASDPKHPDHDRWVKDRTLKMEIEHAQLVGLTLRDAEAENARLLARAEQKAKESGPVVKPPRTPSIAREQRHAERGITRKAPKKARLECACGLCVPCRRKLRVLAIFQHRAADPGMKMLGDDLFAAFLGASTGVGSYKGLSKRDAKRALSIKIDAICDRSVYKLGAWR